ncbi:carbohydrate esterase family 16 protein [Amanita thiersii Skay4041]|uniref:Carbohydrate esterase family 16 protein n=1 Tax=Amanita thiersii Skay4041 TaxID=703135 RepID=A0A2A9NV14_9AGAR|nr:carbohydrate esterase family 16 protein [Amanita thiersii Skay4041]
MKFAVTTLLLTLLQLPFPSQALTFGLDTQARAENVGVRKGQIKNFVTFGDSYTDVVLVSNGGTAWPVYAAGYADVDLFPFARSGATCSNNITFRPFPPLFESQLPLYFSEVQNGTLRLDPSETIYSLWIGTNDVGSNALLTGSDNASLVDVIKCMMNWVKVLYKSGARNFIFMNMVPLDRLPLYSADSYPNKFWTAARNTTEWSVFMKEMVLTGNELARVMLTALPSELPHSHIALFDSHSLFNDIVDRPALYLNGTAPLNTTGAVLSCVYQVNEPTSDPGACTLVNGSDRDSYAWFDELHPSEQADRVVAHEIAKTINGEESQWVTWLS